MLSYRHVFHAGNYADVLKHIVLIEILEYFHRKDTPFHFIDTHAGAGLYDLNDEKANKTAEYLQGIARLKTDDWPELQTLFAILDNFNPDSSPHFYPGSPMIAQQLLRKKDRAWLFELHPSDYVLLKRNTERDKRIRIANEDGFEGMLALLPPVCRRGLVLIDPSYEVKTDYKQVIDAVIKAHKKFATGVYAIWYPVVERQRVLSMEKRFKDSGIRNIQRYELGIAPDSDEKGMTAAGMIVINPPWTLMQSMQTWLPRLAETIGEKGNFRAEVWVDE